MGRYYNKSSTVPRESFLFCRRQFLDSKSNQAQPDPYEELRKQRAETKNKFGSRYPPFNPAEIQKREMLRDRQINPSKWRTIDTEYQLDKQMVDKRRRDRYLQHFVEKEEEQKRLQEAAAKAAALA